VGQCAEKYVETLNLYGHSNLESLIKIINDHARLPLIVHSVMHKHDSRWELHNQLANLKILGRDVNYTLLDYQGNIIASETYNPPGFSPKTLWVQTLLDGRRSIWIDAGCKDNQPFWRLAVPVYYKQHVEGVLVAQYQGESLLNMILPDKMMHPNFGIQLMRGSKVLAEKGQIPEKHVTFNKSLPESGIELSLLWDHGLIKEKMKSIYMRWLILFCLLTFVIVFFFYIYGKKFILLPQGKLTSINQQLTAQKQEIEGQYQQLKASQLDLEEKTRQLEHEKQQMEAVIKSVQDGIVITGADGGIQMINPAAQKLYGLPESRLLGEKITINPAFSEFKDALEDVILKKEDSRTLEFFYKDERINMRRYIRASIARVPAGDKVEGKDADGFVTVLADLTREKELEHMKTAFVNTAAHELRTPLTTIQGFSELLLMRKKMTPEKINAYAKQINTKAVVLGAIVSRLEDVSAIGAGRGISIFPAPHDLPGLISEIVDQAGTGYGPQRIEMHCQPCAPFYFDTNRIRQVLWDLLSNALTYSSTASRIWVEGWKDIARYFIVIRDQGKGMDTYFAARVFDGFMRADTSDTAPGGFGLSIYLAKHIIDAHCGNIFVETEIGKGAEFVICLPRNLSPDQSKKGV
jgi:PAS domain S-box-containing protein